MPMKITIELTDDQLDELADAVAEKLARANPAGKRAPMKVKAFASATGLSTQTIYRQLQAGQIDHVPGLAKKLIPARELEKFQ